MKKERYCVEISRTNITPRQFFTYCRKEIERRTNGTASLYDWIETFDEWEQPATESNCNTKHPEYGADAFHEICKIKSFDYHLFVEKTYNFIMEFDFWDDKTGFGYLFLVEWDDEPKQPEQEPETAEETENEQEGTKIKNVQNVLDSIQNAAQKVAADRAAYITAHTITAADARNTAFVRECSTPKQWERIAAMQDAEPIAAADIDKLTAKAVKRVQKSAADAAAKVQAVTQNAAPQFIRLYITWTRNAVWGWNPHCALTTWTENVNGYKDETTHGRASGCGYDKTSAACAEALNASDIVRGALVRFVNDGGSNYGVYTADTLNYPVCPYFEGGCGMSTITETLRKMGYKVTDTTHYNRRGSEECRIIEASREV